MPPIVKNCGCLESFKASNPLSSQYISKSMVNSKTVKKNDPRADLTGCCTGTVESKVDYLSENLLVL